jgi:tetratricopeptide (TPR) repeat protein
MSEHALNENGSPQSQAAEETESPSQSSRSRRNPLTAEQRRRLGPGRSMREQPEDRPAKLPLPQPGDNTPAPPAREQNEKAVPRRRLSWTPSHSFEKQTMALALAGLVVLGFTFYLGKNFERWKYALATRTEARILAAEAKRFPGVSAEDLVDQGLVAERLGNWQEAAARFVAAKFKNLNYTGLLFQAGKLYYDHAAFDDADKLFERAIAFDEDLAPANYYRGMIAAGREDFPAAERFFEAASNAAPFNADYLYSLAETLRKDRRPNEAVPRYEQAGLRAADHEALVCRFKARMAMIEAGTIGQLETELAGKRSQGPLSVDWRMTAAALQIHSGDFAKAVQTVEQARASDQSHLFGLFAACAGDRFFTSACRNHADLAQACQVHK